MGSQPLVWQTGEVGWQAAGTSRSAGARLALALLLDVLQLPLLLLDGALCLELLLLRQQPLLEQLLLHLQARQWPEAAPSPPSPSQLQPLQHARTEADQTYGTCQGGSVRWRAPAPPAACARPAGAG